MLYLVDMSTSFYFYDLETSGTNPKNDRIMQFAGQRTDVNLKPIGSPDNFLIKLTSDILPTPDAILITGITPQRSLLDGISEVDFLQLFYKNIVLPETIFVGFNSIHFDDEFMRFLNYRNFYDAYAWQWQDGRSRWDILDVTRMARALRPEGVVWPINSVGRASHKLEHLATANRLNHNHAHDALSDVEATIDLTKLIRKKQPKLYDYLLSMRGKQQIEQLINQPVPFVHSSIQYPSEVANTSIVVTMATHPTQQGVVLIYDLRYDPTPFANLSINDLATLLDKSNQPKDIILPVYKLHSNRCPVVAPLGVLDTSSLNRINLTMSIINEHFDKLLTMIDFGNRLQAAFKLNEQKQQTSILVDINTVDSQLYDGFFSNDDRHLMQLIRNADETALAQIHPAFADPRLEKLLLLYKARQFPNSLSNEEQKDWQSYCRQKLLSNSQSNQLSKYFDRLNDLAANDDLSAEQIFILEELKLYGESMMPYDV